MKTFVLRPAEPELDFAQIANWFSILENEPTSEHHLIEYYQGARERIDQVLAVDEQGRRLGFGWLIRNKHKQGLASLHLYVEPALRQQGIGGRLYAELMDAAARAAIRQVQVKIRDTEAEGQSFGMRHGFVKRAHEVEQVLEADAFDEEPFEEILAQLRAEGFRFTSMEELGNTPDAQRKLYALNDTAAMGMPGAPQGHVWDTFEEFQQQVCKSTWYQPAGQIIAIDTAADRWVAMCAISCQDRYDAHATVMFLGVDCAYRGRKLAQAVSVLALCYARDGLKAGSVYTYHDTANAPAIAIDTKLGYIRVGGMISMEKKLVG